MILKTAIFSLTAFSLAFVYSSQSARPIPRLLTKDAAEVSQIINKNINADSGFICDFWNWETTYYLPYASGLHQNRIEIIESADDAQSIQNQINNFVKTNKQGVILVCINKAMYGFVTSVNNQQIIKTTSYVISLNEFYRNKEIICYNYTTTAL